MSKEIWAKDYIEKIGKGQWKYMREITLLSRDEGGQCVLLGDHQCGLLGDLITEIFFYILVARFLQLRFKSFDRDIQFSDLPFRFQDFFPRSHYFPIFTDLPKVLSPGT